MTTTVLIEMKRVFIASSADYSRLVQPLFWLSPPGRRGERRSVGEGGRAVSGQPALV